MEDRILIVEDEFSIRDSLAYALKKEGFKVSEASKGSEAIEKFYSFKPKVVLLDLMLPDMSGFELCKEFKDKAFIIMVTARDEIFDRINGIESGADDYITKPFVLRELIARVNSIFRRINKLNSGEIKKNLILDVSKRLVIKDGNNIDLKRKEFDILNLLYSNKGKVFSRDEILKEIWGYEFIGETRTVDVHIRRLRAALYKDSKESKVETIFGVGYVYKE